MIKRFHALYVGQIDLDNVGLDGTPANDRRYSNERLSEIFETSRRVAQVMDELGYYCFWAAEHHFQHEATSAFPTSSNGGCGSRPRPSASNTAAASTSCRCGTRSASPRITRWPTSSPTGAS